MLHINKDPPAKPETQWKLMKTCKFYFAKHPIIPISHMVESQNVNYMTVGQFDDKNKKTPVLLLNLKYKFWLTGNIKYDTANNKILSLIAPKN